MPLVFHRMFRGKTLPRLIDIDGFVHSMKLPVTSLYFHDLTVGLAGFLVVAEQSKYLFLVSLPRNTLAGCQAYPIFF